MEPILAVCRNETFHFETKCPFVLAINPAVKRESCQKGKRQGCIKDTKCVLVSRVGSRPEKIFIIAGTLAGNGGQPLQTLQKICRAAEVKGAIALGLGSGGGLPCVVAVFFGSFLSFTGRV